MKITTKRSLFAVAAALSLAGMALTGCSSPSGSSSGGSSKSPSASSSGSASLSGTVGIIFPDLSSTRYQTQDLPDFKAALQAAAPDVKLVQANADADASKQQQQAESMLTQGVKVLVVDPVDGVAAASIVEAAANQNVPVVAYDRIIHSKKLSYVISNDYVKVGQLQATAMVNELKKEGIKPGDGGIVMLSGAATDNNALNMKKGADQVIKASGYKILAENQSWDANEQQKFATQQITRFGDKIKGFESMNDANAEAATAAMKAANMKQVPTTGLDATLAGIQAIIAGQQTMTVYNSFKNEADQAVKVVVQILKGEKPTSADSVEGIPATLLQPTAVTADNVMDTVVKDGVYTVKQICTSTYAKACAAKKIM
jgi:D-xylose transport system substrate-binding protein